MALAARLMLGALLLCPVRANEEKFLPPSFKGVTAIACGVGGGADERADVFVIVKFVSAPTYDVVIAKRPSAWEGLEDCISWIKSLKKPLEEAAHGAKADVPQPQGELPDAGRGAAGDAPALPERAQPPGSP